jgi:hypothetical protein
MRSHKTVSSIIAMGGIMAVLVGGCSSIVDPEASKAFHQSLGSTSITVFPTFVRGADRSYDADAAGQIGEFLTADGLAGVTVSSEEVPITGSWGMNQARMLRDSMEDFAAYVTEHRIDTEYALMAEYLILGTGVPGGIHCYVLDAEGRSAHVVLLNSHWSAFSDANPQTTDDCTAVLIEVLREDLAG